MVNLTEDSPNNDDQLRFDDESSSVELDFDINNTDLIFKD